MVGHTNGGRGQGRSVPLSCLARRPMRGESGHKGRNCGWLPWPKYSSGAGWRARSPSAYSYKRQLASVEGASSRSRLRLQLRGFLTFTFECRIVGYWMTQAHPTLSSVGDGVISRSGYVPGQVIAARPPTPPTECPPPL